MARRPALMIGFAGLLLLALVLVAKDLNDKLTVMTSSNQEYQRMTDSQAHKIKQLQDNVRDEQSKAQVSAKRFKSTESELRKKGESEVRSMEKQLNSLQSQLHALQQEHEGLQREYEELSENSIKVSHQVSRLEAQNAKLSSEAERLRKEAERGAKKAANGSRCHDQYQALFKEHQQASDQLQIMKREKERLQKQLLHQESAKSAALKSSPSVHQIQEPHIEKRSSTAKPPLRHQQAINLEQPFMPNHRISSTSQSPADGAARLAVAAPVAPAPVAAAAAASNSHLSHFQAAREDVMEAPNANGEHVVHRGHQADFGEQYFHQPQQYGYVQQPLDRPSVRQQHHQYVMQAGDSNNLPYHQVPEHEHQQRQEQVQVRQLPRPRQNSRHQQSLHFQRRSPEHQGQLGEEEDDIDNNDDVNFKHYALRYKTAAGQELQENELTAQDEDDDDEEEEEEDEDAIIHPAARYSAHKDGVLQPLQPLQQPAYDNGALAYAGVHQQQQHLAQEQGHLPRRQDVERVFRRYHL